MCPEGFYFAGRVTAFNPKCLCQSTITKLNYIFD
jgi:hypothetical protein